MMIKINVFRENEEKVSIANANGISAKFPKIKIQTSVFLFISMMFYCNFSIAQASQCNSDKFLIFGDNPPVWRDSEEEAAADFLAYTGWPMSPGNACAPKNGGPANGYYWFYNGNYSVDMNRRRFVFGVTKQYCANGALSESASTAEWEFRYRAGCCISIDGASFTHALPSLDGPVTQTVTVTSNSDSSKLWPVRITLLEENSASPQTISGSTDSSGVFQFSYVPPYLKGTSVEVQASCGGFNDNYVSKKIAVLSSQDVPQMCRPD